MAESYRIIRSSRKTIAIEIRPDGQVIIRAPGRMSAVKIRQFVAQKQSWIQKHMPVQGEALPKFTDQELQQLALEAKQKIPPRVTYYAQHMGVSYGRISVRAQRTRWGSCSGKGNLNFNCLLALVPGEVLDYVVVHELCHRIQMDHSPQFWAQVAAVLPDYEDCRKWLKENGSSLIARLPE